MEGKGIVVMDVEGIVIPKKRYLLFEATSMLSAYSIMRLILFGLLYEVGLFSIGSALKRIFCLFKGLSFEDLFMAFKGMPLIPEVEELIKRLKGLGFKVAFISSGLPDKFVKFLGMRLNVDFTYGIKLGVKNGRLTGEVEGELLEDNGKAIVLKRILAKEGLSSSDCIVVVDDRNNLPMFPLSSLRIGYNPDYKVSIKADHVVDSLMEIPPLITSEKPEITPPPFGENEMLRKLIHIGASLIPVVCVYLLAKEAVVFILSGFTVIYVISEVARLNGFEIAILSRVTRTAANKWELYEFITSPISFALGIILSLIFFPEPICYASILTLTLGDSSASIFGKLFGKHTYPFNKGKWVEGTIFGFIFAFIGSLFFVNPAQSLLGAIVGMIAETLPLPLNDNLTVPLAAGTAILLF